MKSLFFACLLLCSAHAAQSQITVVKKDGGSIVTKLGLGIKVNGNSSLNREFIILNDGSCPAQLTDAGIETGYGSSQYAFKAVGSINTKEDLTAFGVHHVLYDIFGDHIKTLANTEIADFNSTVNLSKTGTWYASEHNVSEYLICVSYVANIRKKDGTVWHYNSKSIKEQLEKLKIAFEESYLPQKDPKGKD